MTSRILVGTRKGVFVVDRGSKGWTIRHAALLGDPTSMVLPRRDGSLLAAQALGHFGVKMKRSMDGGRTWEDRPVPAYPEKPDDVEDIDPVRQTPIPWDLKSVWALEESNPDRPDDLWCGTIPGGLFRSRDNGDSWELVDGLWSHPDRKRWMGGGADYPGIHSVLVDPRDSDAVRVGVSCGGLWFSEDDGASWAVGGQGMRAAFAPPEFQYDPVAQDPHRVVQCAASPDRVWIQHHNGIFRSTDGGRTCEELEDVPPSSFGFAVVVHPEEPDTAWFVPGVKDESRYPVNGALVVTRTRDGGRSFDVLTRGLPQQHAYDLTYRHALDIDSSGDCLAFGSTTGNLWLSENQGDDWVQLSGTLPPIYCVRFAAGAD